MNYQFFAVSGKVPADRALAEMRQIGPTEPVRGCGTVGMRRSRRERSIFLAGDSVRRCGRAAPAQHRIIAEACDNVRSAGMGPPPYSALATIDPRRSTVSCKLVVRPGSCRPCHQARHPKL